MDFFARAGFFPVFSARAARRATASVVATAAPRLLPVSVPQSEPVLPSVFLRKARDTLIIADEGT